MNSSSGLRTIFASEYWCAPLCGMSCRIRGIVLQFVWSVVTYNYIAAASAPEAMHFAITCLVRIWIWNHVSYVLSENVLFVWHPSPEDLGSSHQRAWWSRGSASSLLHRTRNFDLLAGRWEGICFRFKMCVLFVQEFVWRLLCFVICGSVAIFVLF